jgi:myo-inositol-1-phosphate synthase
MQELKMASAAVHSKKVRVCVVGVGNCASSFVQGLSFYRRARTNEPVPGLMNVDVGGYHVSDVERDRLVSKKISKTQSITSQFEIPLAPDDIHVGSSDHVPWLTDRKTAYIRLEGTTFGNLPLNLELKLEVWDSPNSAGVVIDAVRCARLAMDRGLGGALLGPSSYFMNSPPRQFADSEARARTIEFIKGDGRRAGEH